MAGRYAEGTTVAPEKSRMEIEQTLTRYGADAFMYGTDNDKAVVGFRFDGRYVRFDVPLPAIDEFRTASRGYTLRTPKQMAEARDKEMRRRWRCLLLAIKAKLEVVASEIASFEDEFLAHIVLPSGMTFGQWAKPEIAKAYETGEMPSGLTMLALPRGDG